MVGRDHALVCKLPKFRLRIVYVRLEVVKASNAAPQLPRQVRGGCGSSISARIILII